MADIVESSLLTISFPHLTISFFANIALKKNKEYQVVRNRTKRLIDKMAKPGTPLEHQQLL